LFVPLVLNVRKTTTQSAFFVSPDILGTLGNVVPRKTKALTRRALSEDVKVSSPSNLDSSTYRT
jgi:hypothetical protein